MSICIKDHLHLKLEIQLIMYLFQEFRHQFEMILEGARQLDEARANLQASELKETKIKKELKKGMARLSTTY